MGLPWRLRNQLAPRGGDKSTNCTKGCHEIPAMAFQPTSHSSPNDSANHIHNHDLGASADASPTQDNQLWRLDGQCPEQPGGVCRSWSKNSKQVRWRRFEHKQQQTGDVLAYISAFPTQFELNTNTRLGIWRTGDLRLEHEFVETH